VAFERALGDDEPALLEAVAELEATQEAETAPLKV